MAVNELLVLFKGKDESLSSTAKGLSGSFGNFQKAVKGAMFGGIAAVGAMGAGAIGLGTKLVNLGGSAEEMLGKFNVVFGQFQDYVDDELTDFGKEVGRSRFELLEMASTFGDTLKPMGFATDAAADMSIELSKLATDLGSFNDMDMSEALERLQGTLIGNHENALAFGVIINENTLKAELAAQGWNNLTGAALEQAKVQARINLLMKGTSDAQGDALRTSGSWTNQMRALTSTLKDAATNLGRQLLPALTPLLSTIGELAKNMIPRLTAVFEKIVPVIEDIAFFFKGLILNLQDGMNPLDAIIDSILNWTWFGEKNVLMLLDLVAILNEQIIPSILNTKDRILEFLEPIISWIQENIQLKDILIAVGVAIASVIIPAIVSLMTTLLPIIAIGAALVAGVSLLRRAWEENWGGIQEITADLWTKLQPILETLWNWLQVNIPIALEALSNFWKSVLLPAIQNVWDWLQGTLIPFIQNILVPWLQENIPAAIQTLKDFWQDVLLPALERIWEFLTVNMLPIWEAIGEFLGVAFPLVLTALQGIWENVLLPAMTKVWEFVQDKLGPIFQWLKDKVIDPARDSFGGLQSTIQDVADWIGRLTDKLSTVSLPDWMTPGSPTPWELGLKGVRQELQSLYSRDIPAFSAGLQGLQSVTNTRNQTINQSFVINTSGVDMGQESRAMLQFATGGI